MRKLTIAITLLVASALSAQTTTFESRSYLYSIKVDVDATRYYVRVTELAANRLIVDASFPAQPPVPMTATSRLTDGEARVQLRVTGPSIMVMLEVERNGMIVDSIQSSWSTKPRPREVTVRQPASPSVLREKYPNASAVGGPVKAPRVRRRVAPEYSTEARMARVSGIVILETVVDKTGVVRDVVVLKPLPYGLTEAAVNAVKQWEFDPATLDGQPVDIIFNLTIDFKLDELENRPPS